MKIVARIGDDDFGVTAAQVMQKNLKDEEFYNQDIFTSRNSEILQE
jgi:hypothetical protein